MTHPDGTPYTPAERRAIVEAARGTAKDLLLKIEALAKIEEELRELAQEGTQAHGGDFGGGR